MPKFRFLAAAILLTSLTAQPAITQVAEVADTAQGARITGMIQSMIAARDGSVSVFLGSPLTGLVEAIGESCAEAYWLAIPSENAAQISFVLTGRSINATMGFDAFRCEGTAVHISNVFIHADGQ